MKINFIRKKTDSKFFMEKANCSYYYSEKGVLKYIRNIHKFLSS